MAEEVKTPTIEEQFKTRETESQANINKLYDNNLNTQKQGLLDAYNANAQSQAQQRGNIQKNYAQANYDIGIQNDRNDRNLTQFADVRDLNHQEGSQHRLNLNNARNSANAKMAFSEAQALQESDRQAMLLEQNYKNQVAAALADNDYKRAAALMDDYNNQDKWREQQAQVLASYGNFEGYKPLYGEETANNMRQIWLRQNPDTAWELGEIDPDTYRNITGRWPKGYNPYSGWGGGYGWGGGDPEDPDKPKVLNQMQLLANFSNNRGTSNAGVKSLASSGQVMKSTGFNTYHT